MSLRPLAWSFYPLISCQMMLLLSSLQPHTLLTIPSAKHTAWLEIFHVGQWNNLEACQSQCFENCSYILACCNIKDKTWLQIAHNIDTQNYLQNCHFIGAKTSEHNEKVMVSSHDVGSNCAPFNGVAQVTVRLVLPFALSVCHGCTKLSCLLRWYILKKVRIPSRLVTNVMSTSHVVCINTKDR